MFVTRIALVGLSLLFFIPSVSIANSLPQSIGPLTLVKSQSGEEARQEIDRLHGKQLDFRKGYIGTYGGEDRGAKVWVSEYDSDAKASEAFGKMTRKMTLSGQKNFWHFQEIPIEGVPVYFLVGMGQAHYFFQKGIKVIWLAVDPPLAKQAIRDLLGKIP